MEMWIPSRRNTTNIQDDRPSPEQPNGRAFRDREFFTRIIRLRRDPPIRYREGGILFSSPTNARRFRVSVRAIGFPGSPKRTHVFLYSLLICVSTHLRKANMRE
ncbi:hypothetical protein PUN28_007426 [Cardiocondyla obscurior]|uniref:Uncharacterized protein n=1 Tax=Cardiocondyla obscurior TaxID=286306 RepID=A0AAW2G5B3_9HYME